MSVENEKCNYKIKSQPASESEKENEHLSGAKGLLHPSERAEAGGRPANVAAVSVVSVRAPACLPCPSVESVKGDIEAN